jgi:hypothetical protein
MFIQWPYYKPMMIVNDDSRVVNKLEASLTDNTYVVIYDCHMFIVQATTFHFCLSFYTGGKIVKYVSIMR